MRWRLYTMAWVFVFAVAAYDAAFAWCHRETFLEWELNPAARWAANNFGLPAVFTFKFAGLVLAATVAAICMVKRKRSGGAMTVLITCCYAMLVVQYLMGDAQATTEEMKELAMSPFMSKY